MIRYTGQCCLLHLAFLGDFNAGSIKLLSLLSLEIADMETLNMCFQGRMEDSMIEVKQNVIWNVLVVRLPQ